MKVTFFAAISIVGLLGCSRVVTEEDCTQIRDNMSAAWATEANRALPPDASAPERAKTAIISEGQNLVTEWTAACKDLVGKRADGRELRCMLSAKTITSISKCSEL